MTAAAVPATTAAPSARGAPGRSPPMRSAAMRFRKSPIVAPAGHERDELRPRVELARERGLEPDPERRLVLDGDRPLEREPLEERVRDDRLRPLDEDRLRPLEEADRLRPPDDDPLRPRDDDSLRLDELLCLRPDRLERRREDLSLSCRCGECECSVS